MKYVVFLFLIFCSISSVSFSQQENKRFNIQVGLGSHLWRMNALDYGNDPLIRNGYAVSFGGPLRNIKDRAFRENSFSGVSGLYPTLTVIPILNNAIIHKKKHYDLMFPITFLESAFTSSVLLFNDGSIEKLTIGDQFNSLGFILKQSKPFIYSAEKNSSRKFELFLGLKLCRIIDFSGPNLFFSDESSYVGNFRNYGSIPDTAKIEYWTSSNNHHFIQYSVGFQYSFQRHKLKKDKFSRPLTLSVSYDGGYRYVFYEQMRLSINSEPIQYFSFASTGGGFHVKLMYSIFKEKQ